MLFNRLNGLKLHEWELWLRNQNGSLVKSILIVQIFISNIKIINQIKFVWKTILYYLSETRLVWSDLNIRILSCQCFSWSIRWIGHKLVDSWNRNSFIRASRAIFNHRYAHKTWKYDLFSKLNISLNSVLWKWRQTYVALYWNIN